MLCQRCRGLLIPENLGELRDDRGRICLATRCVNCGCIEDSVVRANRLSRSAKTVASSEVVGGNWSSRASRNLTVKGWHQIAGQLDQALAREARKK